MKSENQALQSAKPIIVEKAGVSNTAGARFMSRDDIPAVGRMFNKIFRKSDREAGADLSHYLDTVFFGSPHYAPEHGSVVYDDGTGEINSAVLAIPMEFNVHGRPLMARLLCAFMADGKKGMVGAARLARGLRASQQDMCFSDNASPVSADHWMAASGSILPIQSLEWRRVFRPLAGMSFLASRNMPFLASKPLVGLLALLDRAILWRWKAMRPVPATGCRTEDSNLEVFLELAGPMTERFAIRPVWSKAEFRWLVSIAAMNKTLGELQCRIVVDQDDRTIGAFLFFGKRNGIANVMNVLCHEGRELDVTSQMFTCLDDEGYAVAVGMAQPFMMNAVSRQHWMSFRHRGFFCMVTRYADLKDAAERNDIYIGGLASESWSRLLMDFWE